MSTDRLPVQSVPPVEQLTDIEYDVPESETPSHVCPYCDRPFRSDRYATVHIGTVHSEACSETEQAAYEEIRDDEEFELFTFHVKAAVTVFLSYFMFTFLYALVWAG